MTAHHLSVPELGVCLPTNRMRLSGDHLRTMVRDLEHARCDSVWVNDHIAAFPAGSEFYPYSANGEITWDPESPQYEALTTCGVLTALTDGMKIGTSVLILPQRHPLIVSKAAATLADLSAGRFRLGIGAGWSRREMTALGWDPSTRGRRMDEQIAIIRASWGQLEPSGPWEHYAIPDDVICRPLPDTRTAPPILIGGMTAAAIRRVLDHGDGWLAVADGEAPEELSGVGARLDALRRKAGRPITGVLKIRLESPDQERAVRAYDAAAAHAWDEISFEFDKWIPDEVCLLVAALRDHFGGPDAESASC